VGEEDFLTERDVISGGLVDLRKAIELWFMRSHVLFRYFYEAKTVAKPTARPDDWVEESSERGRVIQECL
jgi:hypothetical protein